MSWLDDALSNTVGVVWRAASGTVDPWTKEVIIDQAAQDVVKASGGSINYDQARTQATQDVTDVLTSFSLPGETDGRGADPSQVLAGLKSSLNVAGDIGTNFAKSILYIGIGAGIIYLIVTFGPTVSAMVKGRK